MKKVIGTIMCMSLILGNAMFANASKTGDVVAYTVYTDIIASINDYNIESYNINGYSAVVAEELRNYGFYVEWNEKERALYITRTSSNTVTSTYIAPEIPTPAGDCKSTKPVANGVNIRFSNNAAKPSMKKVPFLLSSMM